MWFYLFPWFCSCGFIVESNLYASLILSCIRISKLNSIKLKYEGMSEENITFSLGIIMYEISNVRGHIVNSGLMTSIITQILPTVLMLRDGLHEPKLCLLIWQVLHQGPSIHIEAIWNLCWQYWITEGTPFKWKAYHSVSAKQPISRVKSEWWSLNSREY